MAKSRPELKATAECLAQGCGLEGSKAKTGLMLESFVLYAYVKPDDWLKRYAIRLVSRIEEGDLGIVFASREVLHEVYCVSMEQVLKLDGFLFHVSTLAANEEPSRFGHDV